MHYQLQDLLKIRHMREQAALRKLAKAKSHLEAAIKKVEQRKKQLDEYRIWRKKEEKRLYDEIINKKIKRGKLAEIKMSFNNFKQKESNFEKALVDAKKGRDKAKEDWENARNLYNKTLVDLSKIEEHKKVWLEEVRKQEGLAEDKELEEFHKNLSLE